MSKLIAIVLGLIAVVLTYWVITADLAAKSNQNWTWLGETLTPAGAGIAHTMLTMALIVAAIGSAFFAHRAGIWGQDD